MGRKLTVVGVGLVVLAALVCGGLARRAAVRTERARQAELAADERRLQALQLPSGAQELLRRNGFVVLDDRESWSLVEAYGADLEEQRTFISADAGLYLFHALFSGGLSAYEKQTLLPLARQFADRGLALAQEDLGRRQGNALLAEPARRNVVFFAVAQALLYAREPAAGGAEARRAVLRATLAQDGGPYPEEDFTVYRPRGAYAADPQLAAYFRGTKWLERTLWPVVPGGADREPEASGKLRQAYLLACLLQDATLGGQWQQLAAALEALCGPPDSLTPRQLHEVGGRVEGFPGDQWVAAVRREFSNARWPVSRIAPGLQAAPGDAPARYVQCLGERDTPDSDIQQRAIFPEVALRPLPTGLDAAWALLGSTQARLRLGDEFTRYPALAARLDELHGQFATYGASAAQPSAYLSWLRALRTLQAPPVSEKLPRCFRTEAWRDKTLTTTLGSWAQLRHDFILYAKIAGAPGGPGMAATFYVEPVPEFWRSLAAGSQALAARGYEGMPHLASLCEKAALAAECEVAGRDPRPALERKYGRWEYADLETFGEWLMYRVPLRPDTEQAPVVADFAYETNPPQRVRHAASGPLNLIVVQGPDDQPEVRYCGWVLSYYEFDVENLTRLTDQQWQEGVRQGRHHAYRPTWAASYLYRP